MSDSIALAIKPIVRYPRVAQVGKTYLMTIDLEVESGAEWNYDEEEYPVYCEVDSKLFKTSIVGEPVIVLHRFGGSYGESKFLLITDTEEKFGTIKIILVNRWGMAVRHISLESISIVQALSNSQTTENLPELSNLQANSLRRIQEKAKIDDLVKKIRETSKSNIEKRCQTMRILDMTTPIDLKLIYADVNILQQVEGKAWQETQKMIVDFEDQGKTQQEIQEMRAGFEAEGGERFFLGDVKKERVEGLKAVQKHRQLMLLGRPGAGKTTFLKRLAIGCLKGEFLVDQLPIFVTLKEFAETSGQPEIIQYMCTERASFIQILESGRALVLLDGLDEVMEQDYDRVTREIREFAEKYSQNHIVITCRIAAKESYFQQFTEVEVADFSDEQIQEFANRWFLTRDPETVDYEGRSTIGRLFWDALSDQKSIKELAINPLLLTLLCLEFENCSEFPKSRADLCERALNLLLSKWDGQRRIKRDKIYKGLSLRRKEALLSQLAMYTFERGDYIFNEVVVTNQITQFLQNLPEASENEIVSFADSQAILKSIESHHEILTQRKRGIYSFSHLIFHEYYAARQISALSIPKMQEATIQNLVSHIGEKRWEEVFLMTCERLSDAATLLISMKSQIERMVLGDKELEYFLQWVDERARSANSLYSLAAIRAFYFAFAQEISVNDQISFKLDVNFHDDFESSYKITHGFFSRPDDLTREFVSLLFLNKFTNGDLDSLISTMKLPNRGYLPNDDDHTFWSRCSGSPLPYFESNFTSQVLEIMPPIQYYIPEEDPSAAFFWKYLDNWWSLNGQSWTEQIRVIISEQRSLGQDWKFSDSQKKQLHKYYTASSLLVDCLNSECYVSREVIEMIKENLFRPTPVIQNLH